MKPYVASAVNAKPGFDIDSGELSLNQGPMHLEDKFSTGEPGPSKDYAETPKRESKSLPKQLLRMSPESRLI